MIPFGGGILNIRCRIVTGNPKRDHLDNHPGVFGVFDVLSSSVLSRSLSRLLLSPTSLRGAAARFGTETYQTLNPKP